MLAVGVFTTGTSEPPAFEEMGESASKTDSPEVMNTIYE